MRPFVLPQVFPSSMIDPRQSTTVPKVSKIRAFTPAVGAARVWPRRAIAAAPIPIPVRSSRRFICVVPAAYYSWALSATIFPVMPAQTPEFHRREFLRSLASGAAALALPRAAFGQANLTSTKLTDSLTLISGAGNNIVALAGTDGSLLVDCGDAAHAQDVLKITGRVNKVINTHWHLESTGANDAMAKTGAKLVSHVNTQLWMTQEIIHDWEKKIFPPRSKEAWPTETFYTTGKTT